MLKAKILIVHSTVFSLPRTAISYSFTCFLKYRAVFLLTCLKFAKEKKNWQITLMSLPDRYICYSLEVYPFLCKKYNMYCKRVDSNTV